MTPPRRGFALLLVLWVMALVALVGAQMAGAGRAELGLARNLEAAARAEALADATLAEVAFLFLAPDPRARPALDGRPLVLALPGGEARVVATDEAGRVDLGKAPMGLVAALLEQLGLEEGRATVLAAGLADWVDTDKDPRPEGGAEREAYLAAGLSYLPPDGPMKTVAELGQVMGFEPPLVAALSPYVTIFTEAAEPVPEAAAPPVRAAMALNAQRRRTRTAGEAARPVGEGQATAGEAAGRGSGTDEATEGPAAGEQAAEGQPKQEAAAGPPVDQQVLRLAIDARTPDGARAGLVATLRIAPEIEGGYAILAWERASG